jgi:hypothetical protein
MVNGRRLRLRREWRRGRQTVWRPLEVLAKLGVA